MPKKIVAGIVAAIALGGGAIVAPVVQDQMAINALPADQRLKVSVEEIFTSSEVKENVTVFDDQGATSTQTLDYVKYLYKATTLDPLPGEIVSKRTTQTRTVQIGKEVRVYFDAITPYYQDSDGNWWKTDYATTTPDAFQLQTKSNPILSFLAPKADAQTFLTTGAGTGNQTWNVPADWNNSVNQVACIGSGGGGGKNINGPGSGGGGAYASTTNITLTPGGTATYAIGASATTSEASSTPGMSRETYFNGSASSTASLSCAWGKRAGNPATGSDLIGGVGGAAAQSIGTTKFSGGNSGGTFNTNGISSTGGGGSAGWSGNGKVGGNNSGTVGNGGGGGGGGNGGSSSAGVAPTTVNGGNGGQGILNSGSGIAPGGNATVNTGGGGAGATNAGNGGNGACDQTFDSTHGACGGGGGGGGSGARNGGNGGTYGGGGGGSPSGTPGTGGQGLLVIIYTPLVVTAVPPDNTYFELINN